MYVVILNVFLPFVGRIDVGFGVFDEITPADAADVGVLASPDGGADVTNALILCFAVEHIVPHNGENPVVVMDCAAFGTTGASL